MDNVDVEFLTLELKKTMGAFLKVIHINEDDFDLTILY